jgi:hypothetical protein
MLLYPMHVTQASRTASTEMAYIKQCCWNWGGRLYFPRKPSLGLMINCSITVSQPVCWMLPDLNDTSDARPYQQRDLEPGASIALTHKFQCWSGPRKPFLPGLIQILHEWIDVLMIRGIWPICLWRLEMEAYLGIKRWYVPRRIRLRVAKSFVHRIVSSLAKIAECVHV